MLADSTNTLGHRTGQAGGGGFAQVDRGGRSARPDNLDAMVSDARPGIQNFSKSTLPEANRLIRDLRELSQSLKGVSERVEQGGIGGTLGPKKLPDYKPRKER